ncbi:MAG: hypothetical protein M3Q27_07740 [Actinomycetota bacterium]|nr:hypothetical protein [Actinomycetota bacterium]
MTTDEQAAGAPDREPRRLAHAVVDGPHGFAAVDVPENPSEARALRRQWANTFWCSTLAGGCGEKLTLAAGDVRRPYLRHGPNPTCQLAKNPSRATTAYEHLHYQRELAAWLGRQGLSAQIEHRFGAEGRADLHVMVEGVAQSIEVQLSRISDEEVRRRDALYRRHVAQVTWLFGELHARPLAAAAQAVDGVALLVRRRDDGDVEVGVLGYDDDEEWAPLDQCELREDGVWTPHLDVARDAHRRVLEARAREAEREAAQRAEAERRAAEAAAAAFRRAAPPRPPADDPPAPPPFVDKLADVDERSRPAFGTLAWWQEMHPERVEWMPDHGWAWAEHLPEPERTAAQVLAYIVQRIYASGPITMLHLPDGGDGDGVVDALDGARLIRRYDRGGVQRWKRA